MTTLYETFRIDSLDGGMALSFSHRLLDQSRGYSRTFKNIDPSLPGLPKKRPAVKVVVNTNAPPTGLHEYVRQSTGDEFLIVSFSDKIQYRENSVWENLLTGWEPGVPVYFLTFADQLVIANGHETLHIWDGDISENPQGDVGEEHASMRTYLFYENNDLKFTAKASGEDGNNIRVRYVEASEATGSTTASRTGSGTYEDPYYVKVSLAWEEDDVGYSDILSTAQDVKAAVEADTDCNEIVEVEHVPGSDGTNEVLEMSEQTLAGGFGAITVKYLAEYRLRVAAADGSKLRLSHTGDPHLWSPNKLDSNAMEAYVSPDDGEEISGLLNMGDGGILIGKPNSLYGLFGYKRENFVIDHLDPNIGVASHKSMAFSRPNAYFVGQDGIYRVEPGGVPVKISSSIQEHLDETVDFDRLDESVGFILGKLYIVSLPTTSGGSTVFCWHIEYERTCLWTEPSGMKSVTHTKEGVYFSRNDLNSVAKVVPGELKDFDDDEQPIEAEIHTLELDVNQPEVEKDIGDLYLVFRIEDSDYTVSIDAYADGTAFLQGKTATITGTPGRQFVVRIPVGKTLRFLEVAVKNEKAEKFTPVALYYTYQLKDVL